MAMDESYLKSLAAFYERGNYREVFINALSKISTDVKLGGVRSCLAIGHNDGLCEIEFLKHCKANISNFIGIEPDHASAEHLRTYLRSNLPSVESQVFETKIQNWEGPSIPVDLIMMFQVLYFVPAGERQEFVKKVHDSWLVSGGCVAVLTRKSGLGVFERLGLPLPTYEEIEADFLKAGFTRHYEHEMEVTADLTDPDESLLPFFQLGSKDRLITLDDLCEAIMQGPISERNEVHKMAIYKSRN